VLRGGALIRVGADTAAGAVRAHALSMIDVRFADGHVERWLGPGELSERQYATTDAEDLRQWGERVYADQGGLLLGELRRSFRGVTASALKGVPIEVVIEWNHHLADLPVESNASERSGSR
jgi:hypothetical protein